MSFDSDTDFAAEYGYKRGHAAGVKEERARLLSELRELLTSSPDREAVQHLIARIEASP